MSEIVTKFMMMGGYAPYIWSAYSITLIILVSNSWWSKYKMRKTLQQLSLWVKQRQ